MAFFDWALNPHTHTHTLHFGTEMLKYVEMWKARLDEAKVCMYNLYV